MKNDEVWFSNPLYMNDLEELRYGMLGGATTFKESIELKEACGTEERYRILQSSFDVLFEDFNNRHALDTYVFCLSEHNPHNTDGLLSMWRGYGQNGAGAALIFDSSKFKYIEGSPFIISNVTYASSERRRD